MGSLSVVFVVIECCLICPFCVCACLYVCVCVCVCAHSCYVSRVVLRLQVTGHIYGMELDVYPE